MNNIQIWIYLIAGAIYIIAKVLKNSNQPAKPVQKSRPSTGQRPASGAPKTFEELLREFTEEREEKPAPPVVLQTPRHGAESLREKELEKERQREADYAKEGANRQYTTLADTEAKRIYEESIKRAEGARLEFEPDSHFSSSRLKTRQPQPTSPALADTISHMLATADGAKKAVILSEIFNRKY